MIKSTGMINLSAFTKINLSAFTSTSFISPLRNVIDRLASYKEIDVGFTSPMPSFLKRENDIKFMLAPKSHKAVLKFSVSIMQGIEKLTGSLSLGGNFFCNYWK